MTSMPPAQGGTAADPFTASQRYYWRIALELKLRDCQRPLRRAGVAGDEDEFVLVRALRVPVQHGHVGAVPREAERDGPPDTRCAPGDHGRPSLESHRGRL